MKFYYVIILDSGFFFRLYKLYMLMKFEFIVIFDFIFPLEKSRLQKYRHTVV